MLKKKLVSNEMNRVLSDRSIEEVYNGLDLGTFSEKWERMYR